MILALLLFAAADPAGAGWLLSPATTNGALARVLPEVHSVRVLERTVEIRYPRCN
jgi:hypothetical protein